MKNYHSTDQLLHEINQLIAKFNRTFIPGKKDDSHTNFSFDAGSGRIYSHWAEIKGNKYIFCFNVILFQFELLNDSFMLLKSVAVRSKNLESIENEIESILSEWGFDTKGFKKAMHYNIGEQTLWNNKIEQPSEAAIKTWAAYRNMANDSCFNLLQFLQKNEAIRIWPHHFDTGIYVEVNQKLGIGFGLAIKDDMIGEAYFYFVPYGLGDFSINFKNVPEMTIGSWIISENWTGFAIPLGELQKNEIAKLNKIIKQLTEWALNQN